MNRITRGTLLVAAFASVASCDDMLVGPRPGSVLTGDWSGTHLTVTLDRDGGVTEYDCAHGRIHGPLVLDARGRFRVSGMHVREHGGPMLEDEVLDAVPAVYWGHADAGLLTIRVAVGDETLGPFLLRRNAPSELFKCL